MAEIFDLTADSGDEQSPQPPATRRTDAQKPTIDLTKESDDEGPPAKRARQAPAPDGPVKMPADIREECFGSALMAVASIANVRWEVDTELTSTDATPLSGGSTRVPRRGAPPCSARN